MVTAIKEGYRIIDTAAVYGNEKEIGIGIKKCIDEGIVSREDLFIITKNHWHFPGYEETLWSFKKSLENLGVDYIDCYLMHQPYRMYPNWRECVAYSWRAMEEIYKSGKAHSIGVSNFSSHHLGVVMKSGDIVPHVHEIEFHPQYQNRSEVQTSIENNICVMAWGALNRGKVVNEPLLQELGKKYNKTPAQIALKWNIQHGNIVLVRSKNKERIKENFDVWNFTISEDDMRKIDKIEPMFRDKRLDEDVPIGIGLSNKELKNLVSEPQEIKFKLFGVFPFLKKVSYSKSKDKYYLFGFPILTVRKKYEVS